MKTLISLTLLAFTAAAWAGDTEGGLGLASSEPVHHDVTANLEDVGAAIQAANADVKLSTLEKPDKDMKLAMNAEIERNIGGKIKVIRLDNVSGEVLSNIQKTLGTRSVLTIVPVSTSK